MKTILWAFLIFALTGLAGAVDDLKGKWNAKTVGSTSGSLSFSRNHQFRLELKFPKNEVRISGEYKLESNTLTLMPKYSQAGGQMKKVTADAPSIVLELTWDGKDRAYGSARRAGISKITKMELWR